ILLVDDEPVNLQVLSNYLAAYNYALVEAATGVEALQIIENGPAPDLIILDVMMPRMTGYEVCEKVRTQFLPSELPVILLTAKTQVTDVVTGLNMGANDYLTKPIAREELVARIQTQLNVKTLVEEKTKLQEESEQRLRLIVEATPVPMLISRISDGRIRYANDLVNELFYQEESNESTLGQMLPSFFVDVSRWRDLLEQIHTASSIDAFEVVLRAPTPLPGGQETKERWVSLSVRSLAYDEEDAILIALYDVTDRKVSEQRMRAQIEELRFVLDEALQSAHTAQMTGTSRFLPITGMDEQAASQATMSEMPTMPRLARVRPTQIITVHSFHGGTGKSFVTANLAALLAAGGQRVGMIDTNLQSPGLHALLGRRGHSFSSTLNDFLWQKVDIEQPTYDVTPHLSTEVMGRMWLLPASTEPGEMAQILSQGYDAHMLTDSFRLFAERLHLDVLLIDTHSGMNEEALLAMEMAHTVLLMMRPDVRDYEGASISLQVARRLGMDRIMLLLNQVSSKDNFEEIRAQAEEAFHCDITEMLPFTEMVANFDGDGMFSMRYPDHVLTVALRRLIGQLMRVD
ncbi:MAG: response regulator, partial [Chloroflexota bacterium]